MSSEVKSEDPSALIVRRIDARSSSLFESDNGWREIGYLPAFAVRILHVISASRRDSFSSLFDVNQFLKQVFPIRFSFNSLIFYHVCFPSLFSSTERFEKVGRARFQMASFNAGEDGK